MLNSDKTKLKIFENFQIDQNLPKHRKSESDNSSGIFLSTPSEDWLVEASGDSGYYKKQNLFKKLINWLCSKTEQCKEQREEKKKLNPSEFFRGICSTLSFKKFDSEKYVNRVDGYMMAIGNAKKLGQIALVEKLQKEVHLVKSESLLFGIGNVKTITEEQVIHFYKKSKKGLRLDWIKNFTRIIPNKIVKVKEKIDKLEVFDNYVILHFDPNEQAYELTQKEKEDPIIFGVISGSRKLYYVADWKDKYCDLTLETLIDEFGKKAINANDLTVNFE